MLRRPSNKILLSLAAIYGLLSLGMPNLADAQICLNTGRYTYSAIGSEVSDSTTGLIWQRCIAGLVWNGTSCSGSATTYNHEQALTYAKSQSPWRLPNVRELASIVDHHCINPALDSTAFPNTAVDVWYWTSSPNSGPNAIAWFVGFYDGAVSLFTRNNGLHVRLVRNGP